MMAADDITPGLLQKIEKDFAERIKHSEKLNNAIAILETKKATYADANVVALEAGEILASLLSENITSEILPDGKMYYNIAERVLNKMLGKNYKLISAFSSEVQEILNKAAKIGLKTQVPKLNQDRIDGLVNRISSTENFDDVKWLLDDPIVNFSQSIVDDFIEANASFQAKTGLKPQLIRRAESKPCAWCQSLAGIYDYANAPEDIYRRHERCRCTVEYDPRSGRRQDVWSKTWN